MDVGCEVGGKATVVGPMVENFVEIGYFKTPAVYFDGSQFPEGLKSKTNCRRGEVKKGGQTLLAKS